MKAHLSDGLQLALLFATAVLCTTYSAAADICKTVAADGSVVFSDCAKVRSEAHTELDMDHARSNSYTAPPVTAPARARSRDADLTAAAPDTETTDPQLSLEEASPSQVLPGQAEVDRLLESSMTAAREELDAIQAQYDARCEAAREELLAPERAQIVKDCVSSNRPKTREQCIAFAADHGMATARRGPLYFHLPECEAAFALERRRKRSRNAD